MVGAYPSRVSECVIAIDILFRLTALGYGHAFLFCLVSAVSGRSKILAVKAGTSMDWPICLVGLPALSARLLCRVPTSSACSCWCGYFLTNMLGNSDIYFFNFHHRQVWNFQILNQSDRYQNFAVSFQNHWKWRQKWTNTMKVNEIKVLYCEVLLDVMKFCPVSFNFIKYHLVLEKTENSAKFG